MKLAARDGRLVPGTDWGMDGTLLDSVRRDVEAIADIAFTAGCGLNTSNPWGAVTTYPPEWIQIYVREGYQSRDPLLAYMCKGRGAISWADVPLDDSTRPMMEHAHRAGLPGGTVFANCLQGNKCSVSVCHSKQTLNDEEIEVLERFTTVYAMSTPRPGKPPRDEEYLHYLFLAANGASTAEMQSVLDLSYRGLGVLKKESIDAMGAKTLTQAITNAIEANFI